MLARQMTTFASLRSTRAFPHPALLYGNFAPHEIREDPYPYLHPGGVDGMSHGGVCAHGAGRHFPLSDKRLEAIARREDAAVVRKLTPLVGTAAATQVAWAASRASRRGSGAAATTSRRSASARICRQLRLDRIELLPNLVAEIGRDLAQVIDRLDHQRIVRTFRIKRCHLSGHR